MRKTLVLLLLAVCAGAWAQQMPGILGPEQLKHYLAVTDRLAKLSAGWQTIAAIEYNYNYLIGEAKTYQADYKRYIDTDPKRADYNKKQAEVFTEAAKRWYADWSPTAFAAYSELTGAIKEIKDCWPDPTKGNPPLTMKKLVSICPALGGGGNPTAASLYRDAEAILLQLK